MRRRANRVLNLARRIVPVQAGGGGGRLKNSLSMEIGLVSGTVVARVGTNVYYGLYIHEGTANKGTGYIYPKNSRLLKFPVINNSGKGNRRYKGGATQQYAYAKRVKGIKPRPFLRDALSAAKDNK
jgi:hypothetical protein